jgi:hypothetical protein
VRLLLFLNRASMVLPAKFAFGMFESYFWKIKAGSESTE